MNRVKCIQQIFLLTILFSVSLLQAAGQKVSIDVKAPSEALAGEVFRVVYTVRSDVQIHTNLDVNTKKFELVDEPSISRSVSNDYRTGEIIFTTTAVYLLQAPGKGKYTIPQGVIKIAGKTYKSNMPAIQIHANGEEIAKSLGHEKKDAFVEVILSKQKVNIGDTLTMTYRLYTTHEISRVVDIRYPDMSRFAVRQTNTTPKIDEKKINGTIYKVIELQKLILQPQATGRYHLPEGNIVLEYSTPTGRKMQDFWGQVYEEVDREQKVISIEPVTIVAYDMTVI